MGLWAHGPRGPWMKDEGPCAMGPGPMGPGPCPLGPGALYMGVLRTPFFIITLIVLPLKRPLLLRWPALLEKLASNWQALVLRNVSGACRWIECMRGELFGSSRLREK